MKLTSFGGDKCLLSQKFDTRIILEFDYSVELAEVMDMASFQMYEQYRLGYR